MRAGGKSALVALPASGCYNVGMRKVVFLVCALASAIVSADSPLVKVWSRTIAIKPYTYGLHTAVDQVGNVAVVGVTQNGLFSDSSSDWFIRVFNSKGALRWSRQYNGTGNSMDIPNAAAFDGSGNLIVAGFESFTMQGSQRALLRKYSTTGGLLWNRTFVGNFPAGPSSYNAIPLHKSGNIFVTGAISYVGRGTDAIVAVYSSGGTRLDYKVRASNGLVYDGGTVIALDLDQKEAPSTYTWYGGYGSGYMGAYDFSGGKLQAVKVLTASDTRRIAAIQPNRDGSAWYAVNYNPSSVDNTAGILKMKPDLTLGSSYTLGKSGDGQRTTIRGISGTYGLNLAVAYDTGTADRTKSKAQLSLFGDAGVVWTRTDPDTRPTFSSSIGSAPNGSLQWARTVNTTGNPATDFLEVVRVSMLGSVGEFLFGTEGYWRDRFFGPTGENYQVYDRKTDNGSTAMIDTFVPPVSLYTKGAAVIGTTIRVIIKLSEPATQETRIALTYTGAVTGGTSITILPGEQIIDVPIKINAGGVFVVTARNTLTGSKGSLLGYGVE